MEWWLAKRPACLMVLALVTGSGAGCDTPPPAPPDRVSSGENVPTRTNAASGGAVDPAVADPTALAIAAPDQGSHPGGVAVTPDDGSRYTGLAEADCKVTDIDTEAGGSTSSCPGAAGYRLVLHDSDARMTLDVLAPDGSEHPLRLSGVISSAFSSLGPRAEWRFADGGDAPHALIVRFDAYEFPEQPERKRSYLAVARLGGQGTCVVARVEPGPDQNLRARRIADDAANAACLEPGGR